MTENEKVSSPAEEEKVEEQEQDVGIEDLGIDLDALVLPEKSILGDPKVASELRTGSSKEKKDRDESLFNWCEQFNFAPGIDYVSIERLHPKIWEGISIGGFIEHIYEPVDEHWIAERWGGGSYQFKAHQRDATGRNRIVKQKFVEISGLPKSFIGRDGEMRSLPREGAMQSSTRSDEVLRRRMGMNRFIDRNQPDDQPERRNIDNPLMDAATLYQAQQGSKKAESEALGVLREAQKDVHEQMSRTSQQQQDMYRTLLDNQKEELVRVREEQRASEEKSTAPFRDMLQFLSARSDDGATQGQLETLRRTHEDAVKNLMHEHTRHVDELRSTNESRLLDLRNEVERARQDYQEKERASKDEAFRQYQTQIDLVRQQLTDVRERHRDETTQLRADLSEARQQILAKDHESRTSLIEKENILRTEYRERENQLRNEHRDAIDKATKALEKAERTFREDRDRLTNESRQAKVEYMSILTKEYTDKYEERERLLRESFETQLKTHREGERAREELSRERQQLHQTESTRDKETQRLILENTHKTTEALASATRTQLETRVSDLQSTIRKLEKETLNSGGGGGSDDPFEQLTRLAEIKDRLKTHGFISNEDDKVETKDPPKDFLGKIAHYGPQILGPILQRVDNATAVAQQAVAQQQTAASVQQQAVLKNREEAVAQQKQLEVERLEAKHRQDQLRERREMLMRRRAEREPLPEPIPTVEPMPVEETPPPYEAPPLEVVLPPSNETEMSMEQLAQFLAASLEAREDVATLTGKVQMAQASGMFSEEDKQAFFGIPFDELIKRLSTFDPKLRSPRARKYLKAIHMGLQQ